MIGDFRLSIPSRNRKPECAVAIVRRKLPTAIREAPELHCLGNAASLLPLDVLLVNIGPFDLVPAHFSREQVSLHFDEALVGALGYR